MPFAGIELEFFSEGLDLLIDPVGAVVVADSFSVAVPELDFVVGEDFDECAGVVVLNLGEPSHVEEDACFGSGDAAFGSRGEDILGGWYCEFHLCSPWDSFLCRDFNWS